LELGEIAWVGFLEGDVDLFLLFGLGTFPPSLGSLVSSTVTIRTVFEDPDPWRHPVMQTMG